MGKRHRGSHADIKAKKKAKIAQDDAGADEQLRSGTVNGGRAVADERFVMDGGELEEGSIGSEDDLAGLATRTDESEAEEDDDEAFEDDGFADDDPLTLIKAADLHDPEEAMLDAEEPVKRVIDPSSLTSLSSKTDRSGILYLPRIPPGMGPGKVKHLLSKWGKVGRVYLAREEEESSVGTEGGKRKKRKREKHRKHDFKEGWVEMEDKKVARRMAELLNARPIGGKPSSPYVHDLWSLTYLPRFKWSHLSDQIAYERQSRQHALRRGLEQSKREQEWYLEMVEKARVQGKMQEKEEAREEKRKEKGGARPEAEKVKKAKEGRKKVFKQREAMGEGPKKPKASSSNKAAVDMSAVLNGLL